MEKLWKFNVWLEIPLKGDGWNGSSDNSNPRPCNYCFLFTNPKYQFYIISFAMYIFLKD